MAEETKKEIKKDQEVKKPAGSKKEELSEKDLDKASGGGAFKGYVEFND